MGQTAQRADVETILADWVERDLAADAAAGKLAPAFEVDELVQRLADLCESGRHPIVIGASGVGKSAVMHELLRRVARGEGPRRLQGRPVLQISIRNRASALAKADQIRPAMQKLVAALLALGERVVPFFRDLDVVYAMDLEPQLQLLALRFPGVILAEGDATTVEALLEHTPELDRAFITVKVHEPDLATTRRILAQWSAHEAGAGRRYAPGALAAAVDLSHRFLSRTRMPRKALDFLAQVGSSVGTEREIEELDVVDRFHAAHKIPRLLIDPRVPLDPVATARDYTAKVLEQPEAVAAVVRMMSMIKAGLSDPRRPFGAFLFVGPTGVGKTHIAQLLAEHLFGSRDRLVRVNMADYPDEDHAFTLFGRPNDYNLRARRGELAVRLQGHPFAVVLFDELEKANHKIHDRLLQLIDEGVFVNGAGEVVSCRSSILIATSNAGAEVYRGPTIGFSAQHTLSAQDRELDRRLLTHFRLEFLNRFDQIVHFHPLARSGIRAIALREVQALAARAGITNRQLTLGVDEAVVDWLAAHGHDPQYGARFLRRTSERYVTTAVAELLVTETPPVGSRIELICRAGGIRARIAPTESGERSKVRLPVGTVERPRTLDRAGLVAEAARLQERAAPLQAALAARRAEAAGHLARMGEPGFWDDPAEARRTVDAHRELDLANQLEERLAGNLGRLHDTIAREAPVKALAAAVEHAARALAEWERRIRERGAGAVWVIIRSADALDPAEDWLGRVAELELDWCRRLQLAAELVAFSDGDGPVTRIVLEVEGPGAHAYLAMEQGVHRLCRSEGADQRLQIEVVPQRRGSPDLTRVAPLAARRERYGVAASFGGAVERPGLVQLLELCGPEHDTLARLFDDLAHTPFADQSEVARLYAHEGAGARDPRTRAVVPRFKDALAGKLDTLLDAWLARDEAREPSDPEGSAPA